MLIIAGEMPIRVMNYAEYGPLFAANSAASTESAGSCGSGSWTSARSASVWMDPSRWKRGPPLPSTLSA